MPYQRIFDKNQVTILEKEINNLLSIGVIKPKGKSKLIII
jgi:hypothetical protein